MCDSVREFTVTQIRKDEISMSRVGRSYKPRRAKNVCVCQWCRHPFKSTRYDAKTCSAKCRKALSRFTTENELGVTVDRRSHVDPVIKINGKLVG